MIVVRLFEFEVPKRMRRDMIGTSNSPHWLLFFLLMKKGPPAMQAAQV
jgi:hypothetical protein